MGNAEKMIRHLSLVMPPLAITQKTYCHDDGVAKPGNRACDLVPELD